jgi:hypothetical protein
LLAGKKRLKKMRDAIADLMTDHDWIVLRAEFESELFADDLPEKGLRRILTEGRYG